MPRPPGSRGPSARPSTATRVAAAVAAGHAALRALADLEQRSGRRDAAAARYRTLADSVPPPLAGFARRRIRED